MSCITKLLEIKGEKEFLPCHSQCRDILKRSIKDVDAR